MAKVRWPVAVRDRGTNRSLDDDERSWRRLGMPASGRQRSLKYTGARPWMHFHASTAILKSIRSLTRSQWSSLKTGVMCSTEASKKSRHGHIQLKYATFYVLIPHDKLRSREIIYENIKSFVFIIQKRTNPPKATRWTATQLHVNSCL